jgi:dimethylhistidine N-methyltransferase
MATTTVMNPLLCKRVVELQDPQEVFYQDVLRGLTATNKYLDSKYFYDTKGDVLFQQIMNCHEYYPTNCEMEILREQSAQIMQLVQSYGRQFDVVELGAGDATKSIHLLEQLLQMDPDFTYYPVDISANVIHQLERSLPEKLPSLQLHGLNGEYFEMLHQANILSSKSKLVLCMGGNIGNFTPAETKKFCRQLRNYLQPGDILLTGFDLKKHPQIILNAYNDAEGITRNFNLNLLHRMNNELGADFDISKFDHYPTYDPGTGACKSYLVSLENQQVHIGTHTFDFAVHEPIYMEISQKYSLAEIEILAIQTGFKPVTNFFDEKKWFVDCVWLCS